MAGCGSAEPPPAPAACVLLARRPDAAELAASESGTPGFGSFREGATARFGLRLPAGSSAAWRLELPAGAVLGFAASTGSAAPSALWLEASADGRAWVELRRAEAPSGRFEPQRVALAAGSGAARWLRLRAADGGGEVLVQEPALFVPSPQPRRLLLVFVDTLRADHLGLYGYPRDTSPTLDRLARRAAVFEAVRAPAPWTLPSARAALSGRHPEHWREAPNLPERLAQAGFATLGVVSNAFLGPAFDMQRGWSEYEARNKQPAEAVVDRALGLLRARADRDVLLLVHFMDPHLPYREPASYRHRWAARGAGGDEAYRRADLLALDPAAAGFARRRQDVIDRYDQNIRYLDDQLARLLEAVGPGATVVVFSDHGEEFWEHGGVEHGHGFFEELLRVPLLVRDARLPPGRHRVPVSLLDVAPTLLELVGLEPAGLDGRSLVALARGDASARQALAQRPEAFGRPLYGGDGWGVRLGSRKWSSRGGRQLLFDLEQDPGETRDLAADPGADLERYPAALAAALGRDVERVWRVVLRAPEAAQARFELSHPAGFTRVWTADDPREQGGWARPRLEGGRLRIEARASEPLPPALYVQPAGDPADPRGLAARLMAGARVLEARSAGAAAAFAGGAQPPLLQAGDPELGFLVLPAHAPGPLAEQPAAPLPAEVREALEQLGYAE